eukprot:6181073-Pleurochrysis_carterae.AAC.1
MSTRNPPQSCTPASELQQCTQFPAASNSRGCLQPPVCEASCSAAFRVPTNTTNQRQCAVRGRVARMCRRAFGPHEWSCPWLPSSIPICSALPGRQAVRVKLGLHPRIICFST